MHINKLVMNINDLLRVERKHV